MANHCSISFFIFNVVLVSLFVIGLSAIPAANDLVTSVCSKTQNPPLCLQSLRADPKAAKADLKGLAFISLDIASKNAAPTLKLLDSLTKTTTNPNLKSRYGDCQKLYDSSITALNVARKVLNVGNANMFSADASAAKRDISYCQEGFEEPPLSESPQLREANKKVEGLCNIAEVIGSMLNV